MPFTVLYTAPSWGSTQELQKVSSLPYYGRKDWRTQNLPEPLSPGKNKCGAEIPGFYFYICARTGKVGGGGEFWQKLPEGRYQACFLYLCSGLNSSSPYTRWACWKMLCYCVWRKGQGGKAQFCWPCLVRTAAKWHAFVKFPCASHTHILQTQPPLPTLILSPNSTDLLSYSIQ